MRLGSWRRRLRSQAGFRRTERRGMDWWRLHLDWVGRAMANKPAGAYYDWHDAKAQAKAVYTYPSVDGGEAARIPNRRGVDAGRSRREGWRLAPHLARMGKWRGCPATYRKSSDLSDRRQKEKLNLPLTAYAIVA